MFAFRSWDVIFLLWLEIPLALLITLHNMQSWQYWNKLCVARSYVCLLGNKSSCRRRIVAGSLILICAGTGRPTAYSISSTGQEWLQLKSGSDYFHLPLVMQQPPNRANWICASEIANSNPNCIGKTGLTRARSLDLAYATQASPTPLSNLICPLACISFTLISPFHPLLAHPNFLSQLPLAGAGLQAQVQGLVRGGLCTFWHPQLLRRHKHARL